MGFPLGLATLGCPKLGNTRWKIAEPLLVPPTLQDNNTFNALPLLAGMQMANTIKGEALPQNIVPTKTSTKEL